MPALSNHEKHVAGGPLPGTFVRRLKHRVMDGISPSLNRGTPGARPPPSSFVTRAYIAQYFVLETKRIEAMEVKYYFDGSEWKSWWIMSATIKPMDIGPGDIRVGATAPPPKPGKVEKDVLRDEAKRGRKRKAPAGKSPLKQTHFPDGRAVTPPSTPPPHLVAEYANHDSEVLLTPPTPPAPIGHKRPRQDEIYPAVKSVDGDRVIKKLKRQN